MSFNRYLRRSFATVLLMGIIAAMLPREAAAEPAQSKEPAKVLRHFVLFQFKATSSKADVKAIEEAFAGLPSKIDTIINFEWGTDVSVENKAAGFTHGFLVTFKDEAGRATYLPHPAHQEFVKLVGPHVEKVLVFDYWSAK